MKKKFGKKYYKVDLYHVIGTSWPRMNDHECDVESLGKIIVCAFKNGGTNSRKEMGKCREVMENFNVLVVNCSTAMRFDMVYAEDILQFDLPYKYDDWNEYKNYVVLARDLSDKNLATEEDIKEYDPQKELWYKRLKKIQEKCINYDYEKEFEEDLQKEFEGDLRKEKELLNVKK